MRCRSSNPVPRVGRGSVSGFTLIELLVAAALAALLMMTAIPFAREVRKNPLVRALNSLVDGCREARLKAILQDRPMQLVIYENGGSLRVEPVPDRSPAWSISGPNGDGASSGSNRAKAFEARIDEDVAFRQLLVNGRNMMQSDTAVIRFYPNGTSEALDAELQWLRRDVRRITLDIMTGQPTVEALP